MKKYLVGFAVGITLLLGINEFIEQAQTISERLTVKPLPAHRAEASLPLFAAPMSPTPRPFSGAVQTPAKVSGNVVLDAAEAYLSEHKEEWNLQTYHELRPTILETPLISKVSYQIYQDNLPILGMKIVVELDRFNKVLSADNGYRPVPKIDTDESALIPDPAKDGGKSGRALWHSSESADLTLVYLVQTHENNSVRPVQLVVRATDGQVMRRILARKEF